MRVPARFAKLDRLIEAELAPDPAAAHPVG
jgi:hypothetical protein